MADQRADVSIGQVVIDDAVYPRLKFNAQHAHELAEHLAAGAELPPILLDAATMRLVDGRHRLEAYRQVFGATAVIPAILRTYASEADLLRDAVMLNVAHGQRLSAADQAHAMNLMVRAGVTVEEIALAFKVTPARVESRLLRVTTVQQPDGQTHTVVLKRPTAHLAKQPLTPLQARVNDVLPGWDFGWMARRLREAVEAGLIPTHRVAVLQELRWLHEALERFLAQHGDGGGVPLGSPLDGPSGPVVYAAGNGTV